MLASGYVRLHFDRANARDLENVKHFRDWHAKGTGKMRTAKIVICDDDRAMQEILRQKIESMCSDAQEACSIVCCNSGEEVLREEPAPDILFLDIQMPEKSGMEIAEELRRKRCKTILIFVTALSEYVYDAFDVGAFHYLVKPFSDEKLRDVLDKALRQYKEQCGLDGSAAGQGTEQAEESRVILVKCGGVSTKVRLDDIMYAEVFNRKVMLHTKQGDIEYYGKLTELSEQVGEDFYRSHRAYLVNLKYVEKYTATTIWLEQGTALVAKKQFPGFVRRYMQYISGRRCR